MVAMVRQGHSVREVARKFGVSPPTVQRWVDRADGTRLDRAGFQDLSSAPKKVANRVAPEVESKVLILRAHLRDHSALGEFGAAAIRRQMQALGEADIPSLRTISYILERGGALDYRRRVRRPPPPKGWYLPDVAGRLHEMDQFDFVEGLVIESGINVEVLNAISLHGGLCHNVAGQRIHHRTGSGSHPSTLAQVGMPDYAQFDNDRRFHGSHRHANIIGRVIKMCLGLGVIPVFAPIRSMGYRTPSRVITAGGRKKSGGGSTMRRWGRCKSSRRATSKRVR